MYGIQIQSNSSTLKLVDNTSNQEIRELQEKKTYFHEFGVHPLGSFQGAMLWLWDIFL